MKFLDLFKRERSASTAPAAGFSYGYRLPTPNIIVLMDKTGSGDLPHNAGLVLLRIKSEGKVPDLHNRQVIYRESNGIWHRYVQTLERVHAESLKTRDEATAIALLSRMHISAPQRPHAHRPLTFHPVPASAGVHLH